MRTDIWYMFKKTFLDDPTILFPAYVALATPPH